MLRSPVTAGQVQGHYDDEELDEDQRSSHTDNDRGVLLHLGDDRLVASLSRIRQLVN